MTPSKLWYAQKLATLRNDGSTAESLADQMTIRRLCYEIEKLEEETPADDPPVETPEETPVEETPEEETPEVVEVPKVPKGKPKSFWSRLALETSSDEE
jgi:outer membrane biosynthesis protein TonB